MRRRRSSRSPITASSAISSRSCRSSIKSSPSARVREARIMNAERAMTSERTNAIKTIGVIGAGQMGSGIAHVCALAGYDVRMSDLEAKALENALVVVDRNLTRQVGRGHVSESDKSAALRRIKTGT